MKVDIKKLPDSKAELTIEVSSEAFKEAREKALLEFSANTKMKGFRKGHLPKEVVEKEISEDQLLSRAVEIAVEENYIKAILENNIEALSQPKIEILKMGLGSPLEFKAEVEVLPEVLLPNYKEIAQKSKKKKVKVEEKEINDILSQLQQSRAKFSALMKPAQKGDFVEIEFSSHEIDNGKTRKDAFILGKGHLIPGFEKQIEGMKTSQEKEFSLSFPKEHVQKELAGEKASFKVKMISVQKVELPEINDQFAKGLGHFEDLNALKKSIREGALREKENGESLRVRQEILKNISEKTDCQIPKILLDREKQAMMKELKQELTQRFKMKPKEYFSSIKKKEEEILESFSPEAARRVKEFLVLREIAEKEGIEVEEEEVEQELNKILKQYSDIKTAKAKLDLGALRDYTKEVMVNERIFAMLEGLAGKPK